MARETKQERIVRNMFDQVSDHLHELKALAANPAVKELDIERWCQSVLRSCLGYSAVNGYTIRAQETRGKMRPDLILLKGEIPVCVIEVKKLGYDLRKSDFRSGKTQLTEYLHALGNVTWGILTNGYEWKLYDFSDPAIGAIEILSFDLKTEADELDLSKRGVDETCWEFVDLHETTFSGNCWKEFAKEANAFSPESLARAILSADVLKHVSRVIRGEHEFKANFDVLSEKVADLLERGLDDASHDWNEIKQLELQKYAKGQRRANRTPKRVAAKTNAEPAPLASINPSDSPTPVETQPTPEIPKKAA